MSEYTPDVWVILKITNKGNVHHRVFGGWYGGYLNGDSWKMNSGITRVEDKGELLDFYGESGSVYHCYKSAEKMSGYMSTIFSSLQSQVTSERQIEVIDFKDLELT